MQPQINPTPQTGPQGAPQGTPGRKEPSKVALGVSVLAVVVIAGAGWLGWQKYQDAKKADGGAGTAVRTAVVSSGALQRTLRLTGVTTADKFASLVSPQLRGNRGGGVQMGTMSGGGGTMVAVQIGGGGGGNRGGGGGGGGQSGGSSSGSGSSSSASAASSSSASAASSGGSSSGSSSSGMSSSFRGASNRFGSTTTTTTSKTTSSSSSSAASSSSGSSGGGGGGGGGGDMMSGGMNDFMQVLQSVAKAGSRVGKDSVVAEFDRQYQNQRLDDFKATVEQSERTLKSLDANIEVARKSYQQILDQSQASVDKAKLDIKTTPVRSDIQAETLKLSLEEAEAQLKQVKAQIPYQETSIKSQRRMSEIEVDQNRVELKRIERNVNLMVIKTPMEGMLVMENTLRGSEFAQIQQGDQLYPGQMFARVVDPSSMLVAASVNQADVENVRVGAKAILKFDAYPGLELPAHVTSMAAITRTGGTRANYVKEIPVFLKIDRMDPRVIPDLSVSADVLIEGVENQLVTPLESVFRGEDGKSSYVYVKQGGNWTKREVTLGLRNNVAAAIAGGLKAGEVVALELPFKKQEESEPESGQKSAGVALPGAVRKEIHSGVVYVV